MEETKFLVTSGKLLSRMTQIIKGIVQRDLIRVKHGINAEAFIHVVPLIFYFQI
jgi:hypothetical protein